MKPIKQVESDQEDIPAVHWADKAADELIKKHGNRKIVCASGISPSGMVHIGNFREVITAELVVRALRDRKSEVRFLYSWDDFDALRKVPANLPNPELIEQNLRRPLARIPDPYGRDESYARHFERLFEEEIQQLGIHPEFIYQNIPYRNGTYADGIRFALKNEKQIREILNRSRTEPLPENWTCLTVFCSSCEKDTTKILQYDPPNSVKYFCRDCKKESTLDLDKDPGAKLLWRVDWPMRWNQENVDFEPGGKDHSSQGGSYDTGSEIIREVWKKEPPSYTQYDFVIAKGLGAKLSSSSGNLITVSEALEVYEPTLIRWIFASRKPNIDFSIAFDLDVMKAYDDFDRCERFAYGIEPGEPKKVTYERRIYEFSLIQSRSTGEYGPIPAQFPFRHLCNLLQIHGGDFEATRLMVSDEIKTELDAARFMSRASRAWQWITRHAPDAFRFAVRKPTDVIAKTKFPDAVQSLVTALQDSKVSSFSEEALAQLIYQVMKDHALSAKDFFPEIYQILIAKNQGPKLASFLKAIGLPKAVELLAKAI